MNRKGAIDSLIASLTVTGVIIILMIVLIILSSGLGMFKKTDFSFVSYYDSDRFLLKRGNLDGKEVTVIDAVIQYENRKLDVLKFEDFLKQFVKKGECLGIASSEHESPYKSKGTGEGNIFIEFEGEEADSISAGAVYQTLSKYGGLINQKFLEYYQNGEKKMYIDYYYGKCNGGENA